MTELERFRTVSEAINAGERITRRTCTVCGDLIIYLTAGAGPALYSCPCRPAGASRLVLLSWEQFAALLRMRLEG